MANDKKYRIDEFFRIMEERREALTFDDVRLRTDYTEIERDDVLLETRFSRNITLKIPIVSAAMDTVTEHAMATELAKLGGIGIIHRGMGAEEQAKQVARVKFHLTGRLIERPITAREDETIESILNRHKEKGYKFHSFPVLDSSGKLVGLLTRNDFDLCVDRSLPARAVMTRDLITGDPDASIDDAYGLMQSHKKKVLPLVDSDRKLVGMYIFADVSRIKSGHANTFNVDAQGRLRVVAAIGVSEKDLDRARLLVAKEVDALVIDKAHADAQKAIDTLKALKAAFPSVDVVVGNISEAWSAERLIKAGADGIKIGQGPGSICTTQVVTGTGCPQITAVYNCSKAARGTGVPVCADGGMRFSGDIVKALAAGAHSVMLGNMLAGTDESPGEIITYRGKPVKIYRGMGSLGAMEKNLASRDRYGQSGLAIQDVVPEGIEGVVPARGKLERLLHQYLGGVRSAMAVYTGARTIDELHRKADFHHVSNAGVTEAHPHDVEITRDAPNYPRG